MSAQADYLIPINFGLSEERKMMIDMLKKFKEKECPICRSKIERIMTPIGK